MNRQVVLVLTLLAGAGLAGAIATGVFSGGNRSASAPADDTAPVSMPEPPQPDPADAVPEVTPETPRSRPRPAPAAPVAPTPEPAPPTTATLTISTDVPDAQVFIDNKFIGAAPATATEVAPGPRKVTVQAPGFDSVSEFVDVVPGPRDLTLSLRTIRLDQRVEVKHKHRLGSCEGRLVATPEGLRYETDNRNDGFTARLQELETFEIDYLANNLKVKVRGGRSYDFEALTGTPDALYLFHQEVEKVRQRVLKEGR
jgi:hypothetical protein